MSIRTMLCGLIVIAGAAVLLSGVAVADKVDGKPKQKETGMKIWRSEDGKWHIECHGKKGHVKVYSGTIRIAGANIVRSLGVENLEKNDYWRVSPGSAAFKFTTGGKWDTLTFELNHPAKELKFDIKEDGSAMDPERVHIGHTNKTPFDMPFVLPGD